MSCPQGWQAALCSVWLLPQRSYSSSFGGLAEKSHKDKESAGGMLGSWGAGEPPPAWVTHGAFVRSMTHRHSRGLTSWTFAVFLTIKSSRRCFLVLGGSFILLALWMEWLVQGPPGMWSLETLIVWVKDALVCRRRKLSSHPNVGMLDPVSSKVKASKVSDWWIFLCILCIYEATPQIKICNISF